MTKQHKLNPEEPKNGRLFKTRLAHFVELEKTWVHPALIDQKTGKKKPAGVKSVFEKNDVSFEAVDLISLPPFAEFSVRLKEYTDYERILHGGRGVGGEGRRQTHCLDWLPYSEFSVDRLLFDCAEAIRFEKNYARHLREFENVHDLQQLTPLDKKNKEKSLKRAQVMTRLAYAINPGIATVGLMSQCFDDTLKATEKAKEAAVLRKFGCILFPENVQRRQIKEKTPALLAFSLRWLFQHWPITHETGRREQRGGTRKKLGPPCCALIADIVNAVFPEADSEEMFNSDKIIDLLKGIPPKAQRCDW